MVSVCLPSDALSQHLPSYLGFSYLGHGVSLLVFSSKAQPLLLTLDEVYLLTAAPPDLEGGVSPLSFSIFLSVTEVRVVTPLTVIVQLSILSFNYILAL